MVEQLTGRRTGHRPILIPGVCPAGHLPDHGVRVHAALGRLRPPPVVQGVRSFMLLGLAGGLDGPLDQPRRPLPTVPCQFPDNLVDLVGALREPTDQVLGHPLQLPVAVAIHSTPSVRTSSRW
jgi:hypothetical protein